MSDGSGTEQVSLRERVKQPPADALVRAYYAPSVARAMRWCFEPEMRIHLAHGLMLVRCGIVDAEAMRSILGAVLALRDAGPEVLTVDYTQEDLYSYVERHIVGELGPAVGGRLHTGRSRNDLNVTSWRMALRDGLLSVVAALEELRAAVLDMAAAHVTTVMPGYTHTQHAQPITLGYYLLALGDLLERDSARLAGALARTDRSPLGAGALTTTGFPIDREMTASLLGFSGLVEVAYDAVSNRDDAVEAVAAMAVLMTDLSRLAVDLQSWNTAEYGFVELGDAFCSVSSIMPQKKNPQALEHIKAAAGQVCGALAAVLASVKNTSLSDVNDGVTSVNKPAMEAVEQTRDVLVLMRGVLETMTVRPEVMRRAAAEGFGTATELADVIVRETGLSFRIAHNIVGRVVADAIGRGRIATDLTTGDLDAAGAALTGRPLGISPAALCEALDPAANVAVRIVTGGPAPRNVRRMLAARRRRLSADRGRTGAMAAGLVAANARLLAEARALVSPPAR